MDTFIHPEIWKQCVSRPNETTKAPHLGIHKGNAKLEFMECRTRCRAGFQLSKYLPYGPVDMVMPYLLRRAEENRGLFSTSSRSNQHVLKMKELKRRLKGLQFANSGGMRTP
ncbi:hypothetical protein HRI_000282000 [Hibiscus trionum]|uniref:Proline dehydrogenase n=1 Tax=Hibiscus trionum TaxID=183268 RepID=A0A9W7GV13_HIBTR|nr:hypothetical protein HRI_000282000 [Hibiscus trionum]